MKIFIKPIFFFTALALLVAGCEKDETKVVATSGTPGTLAASATTLTLLKANATNPAVTFTVTPANFGFSAATTNTLQLAVKGTNFASPKEISIDPGVTSKSYTVIDFNALALSMSLPTSTNTQVEARIKTQLTSSSTPVYSNTLTLTVNPYPLISYVYVPGDYQGWDPNKADSLISPTSNGIYEGVIYFTPKTGATYEFKITTAKKWDEAYGDAGSGKVSTTGGNLKVAGAGTFSGSYKLTLDLNAKTFVAVPHVWGIIGDATTGGWSTDTDMKYDNGKRTWTVTSTLIGGNKIKFRKDHDWGTNYGGSGGTIALGGADIAVPSSGTYVITLNIDANSYTLVKQ